MELSEDDVLHILKLIDESHFDYFQLEVGDLKISVSKGDPIPLGGAAQPPVFSTAPAAAPAAAPKPAATPAAAPQAPKAAVIPEGHLAVTAPLLGTFYIAPEPGAPRCGGWEYRRSWGIQSTDCSGNIVFNTRK